MKREDSNKLQDITIKNIQEAFTILREKVGNMDIANMIYNEQSRLYVHGTEQNRNNHRDYICKGKHTQFYKEFSEYLLKYAEQYEK